MAQGGKHGLGNVNFKSSVNRAPRKTTPGTPGEERPLKLELKLLADVGLLGLPNAGKSTLLGAITAAKPKIADYPFTTLHPQLGVVNTPSFSFVVSDIPGLIAGAADGLGLGSLFLKHLSRTKILLHLVDLVPSDGSDPYENILTIRQELTNYSPELAARPTWLVFNKADLLTQEEAETAAASISRRLNAASLYFIISAQQAIGTQKLCYALADYLRQANALDSPAS